MAAARSTFLGCAALVCWALGVSAVADEPRRALAESEYLSPGWTGGLVANAKFMPGATADPAHEPFAGTVSLRDAPMTVKPRPLASNSVLGRDVGVFPGVDLSFVSWNGDLVPFTQDVIRHGSIGVGRSFWDIIVQAGRVWSEPGEGSWSRAAFPFALVNSLEGETHNGVASFLYRAGQVSNLRFQIVQQTAPYSVKERFFAAGTVPATWREASPAAATLALETYREGLQDAVPIADWNALAAKVGAARLAGFDGRMPVRDIVLAGLDFGGTFYLKECVSAAGPLPWCDRARFGVWSATKVLANETALLRLAQKFGPTVFDLKLADYVPQLKGHAEWLAVRFEDAINMASGIGNGSPRIDPNDIEDGYLTADYAAWYEAHSAGEKVEALVRAGRAYPWGPGKVARYRDEDMFLLGIAMNNYLKSKEGDAADLWSMLEKEVFLPIGIRYAPTNRTLESGGAQGQPLMAFGYYPTIGDMVRLARLYQAGGRHGNQQLLYAPRIAWLTAYRVQRGLPTGERLTFGETSYTNAFWVAPYHAAAGCDIYYPRMIGWGGNLVALLPGGITGIRIAKSAGASDHAEVDTAGMARVADGLADVCR